MIVSFCILTLVHLDPVWDHEDHIADNRKFARIAAPISLACLIVCFVLQLVGAGISFPNDLSLNYIFVILLGLFELMV